MQDLQARFKEPLAPAMPLLQQDFEDESLALILAEFGDEEDQEEQKNYYSLWQQNLMTLMKTTFRKQALLA